MYNSNITLDLNKISSYTLTLPTNNNISKLYLNISNNSVYRLNFYHNNLLFFSVNPLTDFSFLLPDTAKDQIIIEAVKIIDKTFIANNIVNIQISEASENYNQNYINYDLYNFMTLPTYIYNHNYTGINTVGIYPIVNRTIQYNGITIPNYVKQLTAKASIGGGYSIIVDINGSTNYSLSNGQELNLPVSFIIDNLHLYSTSSSGSINLTLLYC